MVVVWQKFSDFEESILIVIFACQNLRIHSTSHTELTKRIMDALMHFWGVFASIMQYFYFFAFFIIVFAFLMRNVHFFAFLHLCFASMFFVLHHYFLFCITIFVLHLFFLFCINMYFCFHHCFYFLHFSQI